MKQIMKYLAYLAFLLLTISCEMKKEDQKLAPDANKIEYYHEEHGSKRLDNYFWMKERDSKEVLDYIKEENDYTKSKLKHTEGFQSRLFEEITGRIKPDDESVPFFDNGYYYFTRYEEGKEYPIILRKKGNLEAKEEVVIDQNELAKGHDYFALGSWSISEDNRLLAYSIDTVSRRQYTMKFKNLETGEEYAESIKNTAGSAEWMKDNQHLYYVIQDETTLRDHKVYRHKLGTDPSEDKLIFEEKDEEFIVSVGKSKSREYIFIASYQSITTEVQYAKADDLESNFKPIITREKGHEYSAYHYKNSFYLVTNKDAQNFRLVSLPIGESNLSKAKEIVPHREDVLLEDIEIFSNYLVLEERYDALNHIKIMDLINNKSHDIRMPDPVYNVWVGTNTEFDSEELRIGYTSLTTPFSTFDYNMKSQELELKKEKEILGNFNKDNYTSERLWAVARDGKKIPISIVYKKGFEINGEAPLLLYGYGSYGITIDPTFSVDRLSLLDRGFAFAIAHIRGGEDLGRAWYEEGKMLNKKHTFTDFIDCADYLLKLNYTNKDKLFAYGGSAGGLLMGAIANMRPDLWKGVIAAVPFVDVVTTMLDETIPLTTGEYDEWGNPNEKEYYDYMLSYSPYDNVAEKEYPNMLITTGYHDSQVQYWEPLKWTAKLRDYNQSDNVILLNMLMEAGHGGASGRFKRFKETSLKYAFIFDLLGIEE